MILVAKLKSRSYTKTIGISLASSNDLANVLNVEKIGLYVIPYKNDDDWLVDVVQKEA